MRPVDKGHKDKTYNPYTTAKRDLFNAIVHIVKGIFS